MLKTLKNLFLGSTIIPLLMLTSCGGDEANQQQNQARTDSIQRAQAAMEAARDAALIKARIEDSLSNVEDVDSVSAFGSDRPCIFR